MIGYIKITRSMQELFPPSIGIVFEKKKRKKTIFEEELEKKSNSDPQEWF